MKPVTQLGEALVHSRDIPGSGDGRDVLHVGVPQRSATIRRGAPPPRNEPNILRSVYGAM